MLNPRYEYLINKGKEEGIKEAKEEIATKMLNNNFTIEEITKLTGLTEKQILNKE